MLDFNERGETQLTSPNCYLGALKISYLVNRIKSAHLLLGLIFLAFTIGLSSCQKEGEGGTATIVGKVFAKNYDGSGNFLGEFYAPDEDVYIIYGGGSSLYDDRYTTTYDGSFRFQYLTKGEYTVFIYSQCDTCASGLETVIRTVNITANGEDVVLDDLVIRK
jgi:hypothetical protein